MTVAELIEALKAMPQDAPVGELYGTYDDREITLHEVTAVELIDGEVVLRA